MSIPELDFEIEPGSLGGVFTTVEGLIVKAVEHLRSRSFTDGDSAQINEQKTRLDTFLSRLEAVCPLFRFYTLQLITSF